MQELVLPIIALLVIIYGAGFFTAWLFLPRKMVEPEQTERQPPRAQDTPSGGTEIGVM